MSGSSTPRLSTSQQQPKQMSSRLLTMKFMQRATAQSSPSSQTSLISPSNTPYSNKSYSPSIENSSKRRRTESYQTPGSTASTPSTDRAASKAETETQTSARKIRYQEGGETEWVLDTHSPNISGTTNGHINGYTADIRYEDLEDSDEAVDEEKEDIWSTTPSQGRQNFGMFKRRNTIPKAKNDNHQNENGEISSASRSSSSDPDSDSLSPVQHNPSSPYNPQRKRTHQIPTADDKASLRRMDKTNFRNMIKNSDSGLGKRRLGTTGGGHDRGNHYGKYEKQQKKATRVNGRSMRDS